MGDGREAMEGTMGAHEVKEQEKVVPEGRKQVGKENKGNERSKQPTISIS